MWKVPIGQVNAMIHLNVKYWLNPPYYVKNSRWQNNTLRINTIPAGQYFEVRMAVPKGYFAANPKNGTIIKKKALPVIGANQREHQTELNSKNILYSLLGSVLILALSIPIYLKYGREPKNRL